MRRIYSSYAYGPEPRENCWWDETISAPVWPVVQDELQVDVAIVGGGFTGLSAALHLAEQGVSVAVFEAESPGWGASGRNGGFCCLGGSKLSTSAMTRKFGTVATAEYGAGEEAAVGLVRTILDRFKISADTHSHGETMMAHSQKALRRMRSEAEAMAGNGEAVSFLEKPELAQHGLAGEFWGALTTPVGFGLNPRKYLFGLAEAAEAHGARLFQNSPVTSMKEQGGGYKLSTPRADIQASKVLIATNGYSSEDTPSWLAGRYMPTQSTVMVTRPMTDEDLAAQGWFSDQMAYDSRNLLHYFRLMPDRRFLFGMRGGLLSSAKSEMAIRAHLRRDFEQLFPAWKEVESTHVWSGMVCLSRNLVPFAGPIPGKPGMFAGLCYQGNGVAMGSYVGKLLAHMALGQRPDTPHSSVMQQMPKFPLGRARRLLMPPAYALLGLLD